MGESAHSTLDGDGGLLEERVGEGVEGLLLGGRHRRLRLDERQAHREERLQQRQPLI